MTARRCGYLVPILDTISDDECFLFVGTIRNDTTELLRQEVLNTLQLFDRPLFYYTYGNRLTDGWRMVTFRKTSYITQVGI